MKARYADLPILDLDEGFHLESGIDGEGSGLVVVRIAGVGAFGVGIQDSRKVGRTFFEAAESAEITQALTTYARAKKLTDDELERLLSDLQSIREEHTEPSDS